MRIGYLGPRGTFSEEAARRLFPPGPGEDGPEWAPYRTIPEILKDVEQGVVECGVVPIENSIEGSVAVTLDGLVHDVEVQIIREMVLPVRHFLMARPETPIDAIRTVHSHPQALAQCRKTLERLLPGAFPSAATSTAEAAHLVATDAGPSAAIGTKLAAKIYGLKIIAADLQDFEDNVTRFVAVGREIPPPSGFDKTSVVFAFGTDKPGNLYRALKAFADREVNLTKLESRPAKRSLGDYLFFADMEGHVEEATVRSALDELRAETSFFRILGSYPRAAYPRSNGRGL